MIRIGQGYDVHQLVKGRKMMIGGIEIPHELGLLGHSDADVLLHAITDAVIGAVARRDIGHFFPDTDAAYKDADSAELLREVFREVKKDGYRLSNLDCTVVAEQPKMAPYIDAMRDRIAELLEAEPSQVNVKATTSEQMGFVGRGEGIASMAVVLLEKE
ncbi:2-C-methyl-D-erythritol 2,4-cyclodiphosphate synthase [Listeria floridensis FSL S10-1187]|uniref:2-C-methyl-D-erythritol 2,4-cyclodiphosphate synthase n=1 Tax=Listeria floridensis FSL S10-1187 TaxID=1265817 RepID=A0ABP3B3I4_9LIST|nr:2-C-methyl-D-erythritol 2,4-cyclodiphosphate synthase [Listeria floridensis]EUJ33856.1 2-C-methyl-D-erythritol 2,4-cyclodiphosphate synthase [Listeria floridensis FSL S10-1187]